MSKTNQYKITWKEIYSRIRGKIPNQYKKIFGIPRGGSIISAITGRAVEDPRGADLIVDDVRDSGRTLSKYMKYKIPIIVLYDKREEYKNTWLHFPWEEDPEKDIQDHVIRILEFIGEDPSRDGLQETPDRIVRSWKELFQGYSQEPKRIIKIFDSGKVDEMIILKDIEFYSTCEHHFLPFYGRGHIAYIPHKKIIGISKLARILEIFSRRLQIQERICSQITSFLMDELNCLGAGCILEGIHFCMTSRGIKKQKSKMITSSLEGLFKHDNKARAEFMSLIGRSEAC